MVESLSLVESTINVKDGIQHDGGAVILLLRHIFSNLIHRLHHQRTDRSSCFLLRHQLIGFNEFEALETLTLTNCFLLAREGTPSHLNDPCGVVFLAHFKKSHTKIGDKCDHHLLIGHSSDHMTGVE